MSHPIIGWEKNTPVPNYQFNRFLTARDGYLYLDDLKLLQLFQADENGSKLAYHRPLEIVYLPAIRQQIRSLQQVFQEVIQEIGYEGQFLYAYPSKANLAEEVVRTILETGVHYEISSVVDIDIVRLMRKKGCLTDSQMVVCNGFKPGGSAYSDQIIQLQKERGSVIPVVEDLSELDPLVEAGIEIEVGLRQKSYLHHDDAGYQNKNSRFGMKTEDVWQAAEIIASAPGLQFRLYHSMVGSQITNKADFVDRLAPHIQTYAQLRRKYPHLSIFDFGGGMPVASTLDFEFDYRAFARNLLTTVQQVCARNQVPVPDLMGEFGRYTVAEHGIHCFKVIQVKDNGSDYPWYLIDGSIMTSFPDIWALGEHFIVLPLNHLDKPFQQVQLGGLTCDSDDVYPYRHSQTPLYLPVDAQDLIIGFFNIGAYQEMLGGVGGTKHCVIPEADEIIIDRDPEGKYTFQRLPGQTTVNILGNLGYTTE